MMLHQKTRHGKAMRALVIALVGLLMIPLLLTGIVFLSYRASAVTAQEARAFDEAKRQEAAGEAELAENQPAQPAQNRPAVQRPKSLRGLRSSRNRAKPRPATDLNREYSQSYEKRSTDRVGRSSPGPGVLPPGFPQSGPFPKPSPLPRTEPSKSQNYALESVEELYPVTDPKTGKTTYRKRTVLRSRPVAGTVDSNAQPQLHSPEVSNLVAELRAAEKSGAETEKTMKELRQRLGAEFSEKHKRQSWQIDQIEKRLQSLKSQHSTREENMSVIVDRRIDQLLGKRDVLQWDPPSLPSNTSLPNWTTSAAPTPIGRLGTAMLNPQQQFSAVFGASEPPMSIPGLSPPQQNTTGRSSPKTTADLFSLVRDSANTELDLGLHEAELKRTQELHRRRLAPISTVKKVELECQRLRNEVALNRAEIKATSESFAREFQFARSAFALSEQDAERLQNLSASGLISTKELAQSQQNHLRRKKALDEANAKVEQFEQALKLIAKPNSDEASEELGADEAVPEETLSPSIEAGDGEESSMPESE